MPAGAEAGIPLERREIDSGGERIYLEVAGREGPWVVLTHGAGSTHAHWYQQVPVLAQSYRVVTWDQRGFGRSTNRTGHPGPASAAGDLLAVMDAVGAGQAHLVGQSMGGWPVVAVARDHPDRVASLVLSATIGGIWTPAGEQAYDTYVAAVMAALGESPGLEVGRDAGGLGTVEGDLVKSFLYQELGSFADPPLAAAGGQLRSTRHEGADLDRLTMLVTAVVGAADPVFPPAAVRAAVELVAGGTVVELAGAGHSAYFSHPQEWNAAVLDALAR